MHAHARVSVTLAAVHRIHCTCRLCPRCEWRAGGRCILSYCGSSDAPEQADQRARRAVAQRHCVEYGQRHAAQAAVLLRELGLAVGQRQVEDGARRPRARDGGRVDHHRMQQVDVARATRRAHNRRRW
eukprot:scaffold96868_cov79-Phaeocystis_antarctica.AAC.4